MANRKYGHGHTTMTVRNLIDMLSQCNPDATVHAYFDDQPHDIVYVDDSFEDGTRVDLNVTVGG